MTCLGRRDIVLGYPSQYENESPTTFGLGNVRVSVRNDGATATSLLREAAKLTLTWRDSGGAETHASPLDLPFLAGGASTRITVPAYGPRGGNAPSLPPGIAPTDPTISPRADLD